MTDANINEPLVREIHKQFCFASDFDLHKALSGLKKFVAEIKIVLAQNPRTSEQKKKLITYRVYAEKLRHSLNYLHPQMQRGINDLLGKVYPDITKTNHIESLKMHTFEDVLITLKSLCQYADWKAKRSKNEIAALTNKISIILIQQIEAVLGALGECKVNLNIKINEAILTKRILIVSNDATTYLDNALQSISYACEIVLDEFGKSTSAGRPYNALARNFLIKLAYIYESGTYNRPVVSYDPYSGKHSGAFYEFILVCGKIFTTDDDEDNDLNFLKNPIATGKMAIDAIQRYREFVPEQDT